MLGLTLEGGGAKGAYQIGAWKAFRELNIEFDGISGTSVGALNGALILQEDFDLAYEIWHEISPQRVLEMDDRVYEILADPELKAANLQLLINEIKKAVEGHGLDTGPLQEMIYTHVNEERIRQSKKDFGFVTVNMSEYKPMEIYKEQVPQGKMGDYLIASSFLPVFKSKKLDGKNFLDGGFYDNLPIDMLYRKGHKQIIAIRLLGKGRIKKVNYPDLQVTYIIPRSPLGNMLDFTPERARMNLKLGYLDTMRVMRQLKGRQYYIQGGIGEQKGFLFFTQLDENTVLRLVQLFKLPQDRSTGRLLFEGVVPKLAGLLDLDKGAGYGEILLGLLEAAAEHLKVDPHTIYSVEELVVEIYRNREACPCREWEEKGFFLATDWIKRLDRNKMLEAVLNIFISGDQITAFWIPAHN